MPGLRKLRGCSGLFVAKVLRSFELVYSCGWRTIPAGSFLHVARNEKTIYATKLLFEGCVRQLLLHQDPLRDSQNAMFKPQDCVLNFSRGCGLQNDFLDTSTAVWDPRLLDLHHMRCEHKKIDRMCLSCDQLLGSSYPLTQPPEYLQTSS